MRRLLLATSLVLGGFFGCDREDPRLADRLHEEALELSKKQNWEAAIRLYQEIQSRFPDSPKGQIAYQQISIMEDLIARREKEHQIQFKEGQKRIVNALTRYKTKRGEYPQNLQDLLPEYLDQLPMTPWGHPWLYRPYVQKPVEELPGRKGKAVQKINTKLDGYYLISLGTDLKPGGQALAQDVLIKEGEVWTSGSLPPLPEPQPIR